MIDNYETNFFLNEEDNYFDLGNENELIAEACCLYEKELRKKFKKIKLFIRSKENPVRDFFIL